MKLSTAQVYFLHILLVQINYVILRRWSIEFKWVNYPISRTYLSLENVFVFFITHTSETALEWIFPKFKHIYEPISSQQSYRKSTHADWCSSKHGIENLGNFEEHWAKAEPKNSISHLIYKANNQLCAHKYFALVFPELLPGCHSAMPNCRGSLLAGVGLWNYSKFI